MKSIIFPTDFSSNSMGALRWALALARQFSTRLVVINTSFSSGSGSGMLVNLRERLIEEAEGNMKTLMQGIREGKYGNPEGVEMESHCVYEPTIEGILSAAEEFEAMMICMGTRGASGLEEVLLGSNTSAVISRAEIPVLAVPEGADFKGIHRLAFATDLSEADFGRLKEISSLAASFEANLEFVHILLSGQSFEDHNIDQYTEKIRREIEYSKVTLKLVKANEVNAGILDYLRENDVQMLVMLRRRKNFWQRLFQSSHTRKVVLNTAIPLMVYRESKG
ncbi:MAG: universal stress protein [Bacteroidia bacterium]|nr:universal stress protein [Bacteroidia bacterium]